MSWNYFSVVCFAWAAVGLVTRLLIVCLGDRWKRWERTAAYTVRQPRWLYAADLLAVAFVAFTWYQAAVSGVRNGWIAALLLTLVLVKALFQLYRYDEFRRFAQTVLADRALFGRLNLAVAAFSLLLIGLGIYYL